jgi:cytochrome c-type biogenesis protein CcmE
MPGKAYRLGGMVKQGTLAWNAQSLDLAFTLSDGRASVPVRHKGAPPDLFAEGRGAVVEGTWTADGYFKAGLIMAKHSEEYKAPHNASQAGYKELLKTLRGDPAPARSTP